MEKMAVLGWGSLIWDPNPQFDQYVEKWLPDGPQLPIEFVRISKKRSNALTLVIDRTIGTKVHTLYAISKRTDPGNVISDLQAREETPNAENIGFVNLLKEDEYRGDEEIRKVIKTWASERKIQFVAWTNLKTTLTYTDNFIESAIEHLKSLDVRGIREAIRYIVNAPPQIDTCLRQALRNDPWFNEQRTLYRI